MFHLLLPQPRCLIWRAINRQQAHRRRVSKNLLMHNLKLFSLSTRLDSCFLVCLCTASFIDFLSQHIPVMFQHFQGKGLQNFSFYFIMKFHSCANCMLLHTRNKKASKKSSTTNRRFSPHSSELLSHTQFSLIWFIFYTSALLLRKLSFLLHLAFYLGFHHY